MLLHVLLDEAHVLVILQEGAVVVAVLPALILALEIVVAGRALLVAVGAAAVLDHLVDPPLFGVGRGIDERVALAADVAMHSAMWSACVCSMNVRLNWNEA